jgi:hypothetical protein
MPKIGNTSGPGPINNPEKKEEKTKPLKSRFFNPHMPAKSLKGRVEASSAHPNMTSLFNKIKSS